MSRPQIKLSKQESGFTIVELMVATVIFSIVLLVLTFGVIQMTRTYYKGVTETKTQNAERGLVTDISQNIEFGGGAVSLVPNTGASSLTAGKTYGFCIGSRRYYYQLGYELEDTSSTLGANQAYHGLVVIDNDSTCPNDCGYATNPPTAACPYNLATSRSIPSGAQELLEPKMRLSSLMIAQPDPANTPNLYDVNAQVTYGDDVLLNNPLNLNGAGGKVTNCIGGTDQEFCATSELSTVIRKQVN